MDRIKDTIEYCDDFLGAGTFGTSASEGDDWVITDTSAAGTPTYARGGIGGEATLTFSSDAEVQNLSLDHGDVLGFDIDDIDHIAIRVKTVAALDAANTLTFGLRSARNDDPDATTAHAQFKLAGSSAVVVETDDGSTDNDDVATGKSLVAAYQEFVISFAGGKSDVKFYVDGARVASGTTFSMAAYAAGLQPFVQLQKTADANTDSVSVDYIRVVARRP